MGINERRALLTTTPNPDETLDYITGLQGALQVFDHGKPAHLAIRYVPDRLIVNPDSFGRYLAALSGQEWQTLEQLATTVLSDLSNQLVARWFRVSATAPEGAYPGLGAHDVLVEERQPGWDNPSLLSRMETV
jgi:hypothetical protein